MIQLATTITGEDANGIDLSIEVEVADTAVSVLLFLMNCIGAGAAGANLGLDAFSSLAGLPQTVTIAECLHCKACIPVSCVTLSLGRPRTYSDQLTFSILPSVLYFCLLLDSSCGTGTSLQ